MINLHKTIKVFVLGLVAIALFTTLIYWIYPEIYLSYATNHSIKTISEYCIIRGTLPIDKIYDGLRALPDPKPILEAYIQLQNLSLLMIKIAFIISSIFAFTTKEILSRKYKYTILAILFLSAIIFYWAQSGDFGRCWS